MPFGLIAKQPDLGTAGARRRRRLLRHLLRRPCQSKIIFGMGSRRRCRAVRLEHAARLPAETHPDADRSDLRSARLRASTIIQSNDRHRLRRAVRQGLVGRARKPISSSFPSVTPTSSLPSSRKSAACSATASSPRLYLLLIVRGLMISANASTLSRARARRLDHASASSLRLREHGHGERNPAGGGRSVAVHAATAARRW